MSHPRPADPVRPDTTRTEVYATAQGHAYHLTDTCSALANGQALSDWDYDYEFPPPPGTRLPQTHAVRPLTPEQAAADGKHPCAACKPPRVALAPAAETFGHEPVSSDREFFGEMPDEPPACARCYVTVRAWFPVVIDRDMQGRSITEERRVSYLEAVRWPCTSAVVYGLAARTAAEGVR